MKLGRRAKKILNRKRLERESFQNSELYNFFKIKKSGYLIISRKRIGLHEAEDFRRELVKYLESYKKDITVDTANLDDLDCAGIAVILMAEGAARKKGLYLIIEGLHGKPQHIARITKLEGILTNPRSYTIQDTKLVQVQPLQISNNHFPSSCTYPLNP